jgi:hypothetical protein
VEITVMSERPDPIADAGDDALDMNDLENVSGGAGSSTEPSIKREGWVTVDVFKPEEGGTS